MRTFLIVCSCLLCIGSAVHAATFADITFDAASKRAAAEKKWVLVDFYTTWCAPCKVMDKVTWPDAAVTRLVDARCVPLRLDAEKEAALAARFNVDAFPTVLVLKPDGTEVGRIVGYRDANSFVNEFNTLLDGRDAVARARAVVAETGGKDPAARMRLAVSLANAGYRPESLAEYLWCFDHGGGGNAEYDTLRLMKIPRALVALARTSPAAGDALEARVAVREEAVRHGVADENALRELIALNGARRKASRTLALFDSLPRENKARLVLSKLLIADLIEAKRYGDALDGVDPFAEFALGVEKMRRELAGSPPDRRRMLEPFFPELVVDTGAPYFEALAGVRRDADARALAAAILAITDTPEARGELHGRAKRAGSDLRLLP